MTAEDPPEASAPTKSSNARPAVVASSIPAQSTNVQAVPFPTVDLPPGWMELKADGTGQSYYHNTNTGVTQWDRPMTTPPLPSMPSYVQQPAVSVTKGTVVQSSTLPMTNNIPQLRTSGKAVASMWCGIIGILIFGIILGPIAIGLGSSAKKDIAENPDTVKGECQANAGITCGIIGLLLWVIWIIVWATI